MRWFGSCLLEGNHGQRMLLMVGVAQSSKTTLINVVKANIGLQNCGELRTHFLNEKFELGRMVGKTLLSASDVAGNFLQHEAAQVLKKIVGHDKLSGEVKGSMTSVDIRGDFAVVITCNETLLVRLRGEADVGAWGRRLLIIPVETAVAAKDRIENFVLIRDEG
jgi:phage/plasmid-associated DNA primase